jgi:hypothetical protein
MFLEVKAGTDHAYMYMRVLKVLIGWDETS